MGNQRFSITPAAATTDNELPDSVFRTLAVIGIYGDKNGWCWPSQSTLAELRNVSRKTINVHIKHLTSMGYLNIAPRYDEETGAQKSNMMQIKFDFSPIVTGGVTPKTLQGVSPLEGYRGGEAQGVTHNAPNNNPLYIEPEPEILTTIKTALSKSTKTPLWENTIDDFNEAAHMLIGWDATINQIESFPEWWNTYGQYDGLPALKSLIQEWRNYISGVEMKVRNGNGVTGKVLKVGSR